MSIVLPGNSAAIGLEVRVGASARSVLPALTDNGWASWKRTRCQVSQFKDNA